MAFADTVSVEEPSPDRRQPAADPACGGNLYAHIDYTRQLAIKGDIIADGLARIGRVVLPAPVAVAGSPGDGYRMRARLHVQQGRIGFFREGSRQLCDPRATRQLLASTCDVIDALADACPRAPSSTRSAKSSSPRISTRLSASCISIRPRPFDTGMRRRSDESPA